MNDGPGNQHHQLPHQYQFDENDPFATLGDLGNKLNTTATMIEQHQPYQQRLQPRPGTAPQQATTTTELEGVSTRHDTFRYDSLLPAMLRGQLSPLHDVYMSSPWFNRCYTEYRHDFDNGWKKRWCGAYLYCIKWLHV